MPLPSSSCQHHRPIIRMTLLLASCILSCDALNLLKFTQRQPSLARSRIGCGIQQLDRGGGGGGLTTTATFAKVPTDDDVLHQILHQLGVQGIASHFNPRGVAVLHQNRLLAVVHFGLHWQLGRNKRRFSRATCWHISPNLRFLRCPTLIP